MSSIRLQAHRGVSTAYPENTLPAFTAAVDQGYQIIELDTKYTADMVCVVLHDRTLNRTARHADGSPLADEIKIAEVTFDFANTLDYGLWMGERFRGTKLPTLKEALAFFASHNVSCKFDNVWQSYTDIQKADFLGQLKNADLGPRLGLTCSKLDCLSLALDILPHDFEVHWDGALDAETLQTVAMLSQGHRLTVWTCCKNEYTGWFKGEEASPEVVARIEAIGAEIGIWILHREEELDRAILDCRADAIETTGGIKPVMLEKYNTQKGN